MCGILLLAHPGTASDQQLHAIVRLWWKFDLRCSLLLLHLALWLTHSLLCISAVCVHGAAG